MDLSRNDTPFKGEKSYPHTVRQASGLKGTTHLSKERSAILTRCAKPQACKGEKRYPHTVRQASAWVQKTPSQSEGELLSHIVNPFLQIDLQKGFPCGIGYESLIFKAGTTPRDVE